LGLPPVTAAEQTQYCKQYAQQKLLREGAEVPQLATKFTAQNLINNFMNYIVLKANRQAHRRRAHIQRVLSLLLLCQNLLTQTINHTHNEIN